MAVSYLCLIAGTIKAQKNGKAEMELQDFLISSQCDVCFLC